MTNKKIVSAMLSALVQRVTYPLTIQRCWAVAKDACVLGGDEAELGSAAKQAVEQLLLRPEYAISREQVVTDDGHRQERIWVVPKTALLVREEPPVWEEMPGLTQADADTLNYLQGVQYAFRPEALRFLKAFGTSRLYSIGQKMPGAEGGGLKFATALKAVAQSEKQGTNVFRFYCFKRRRFYFPDTLAHMGGVIVRSLMGYAKAYSLGEDREANLAACWAVAQEDGVTPKNYRELIFRVRMAMTHAEAEKEGFVPTQEQPFQPRDGAIAHLQSIADWFGCKVTKIIARFELAVAMAELEDTGATSYIFQQDCTSDGYQRIAGLCGDSTLAWYTNLGGTKKKKSLYKEVAKAAEAGYGGPLKEFFLPDEAKYFVMRLGYGAGPGGLAKGLILKDGDDWDRISEGNNYCPKKAKELLAKDPEAFNPDWIDVWVSRLDTAWDDALEVSKAYHESLLRMFPKLREFIRLVRDAYGKAHDKGQIFTWHHHDGAKSFVFQHDWDKDEKPNRVEFTVGDRKIKVTLMKRKLVKQASAAPPLVIHSEDAAHVAGIARLMAIKGLPYSPIHDSHGTCCAGVRFVKMAWKVLYKKMYMTEPRLANNLAQYQVHLNHKIWKEGWKPINEHRFMASRNYMG